MIKIKWILKGVRIQLLASASMRSRSNGHKPQIWPISMIYCAKINNPISVGSHCNLYCWWAQYKFYAQYVQSNINTFISRCFFLFISFLSIFLPLSIIQYVGLYVFSLPISLVMIERIYILCLIIIIKPEVWTITHCLGLGHKTMVSAVCLSIFLCLIWIWILWIF